MSKQNAMLCQLCHKAHATDEASKQQCAAWCGENDTEIVLPDNKSKE